MIFIGRNMWCGKVKALVSGGRMAVLARGMKVASAFAPVSRSFSLSFARHNLHTEKAKSGRTYTFQTLSISHPCRGVLQVELNRPDRLNAFNDDSWREIGECFNAIAIDPECRTVILGGLGKHFCAGIDLAAIQEDLLKVFRSEEDAARKAFRFRYLVRRYQESLSSIEKCPKPVIAAVHGHCIGAGVDMISACDIRYCTDETYFSIKEVDIGMAADVGTLQRFPKIVGNDSLVRELALTGRRFVSGEASKMGFVSRVFDSRPSMMSASLELAQLIASKSPVAVQGTKINLNYSRDHSVQEGLDHMITWQMAMLQTEDLMKAAMAGADRTGQTVAKYEDVQ